MRVAGSYARIRLWVLVGNIDNVPAQVMTRFKDATANGARIVGFDNERGKGDHCHLDGVEVPYVFTGVAPLIEDFIAAVAARRAPWLSAI